MVGLFSFDGPMYKDRNGVYCNTTITAEMFSRYFYVVDKLIVVIRTFNLSSTYQEANLTKVDLAGLHFIEIANLNSVYGFIVDKPKCKEVIKTQVEKADLIFARMPSVISDITITLAKSIGKKYMVEVGGCAWDSYWNHSLIGKLIAPYMYFKESKGIKNAAFASYVTERWLQKRYPSNCPSIAASNVYLGLTEESVLECRIEKIKKDYNDPMIIGTTAAVSVRYKGQEYIIRAISKLNKIGYNFIYELVGGGDNTYLKELAKKLGLEDKVRFKGLLLPNEVIKWLDTIDIYAQPSKQEGLPRALIEAMSRGCPAIGSATAGIPELLDSSAIFKRGNVREICNILVNVNEERLIEYAKQNFDKAKEYEIGHLNTKRNNLYEKYSRAIKYDEYK